MYIVKKLDFYEALSQNKGLINWEMTSQQLHKQTLMYLLMHDCFCCFSCHSSKVLSSFTFKSNFFQ